MTEERRRAMPQRAHALRVAPIFGPRYVATAASNASGDRDGDEIEDLGSVDNLILTESVVAVCPTFEEAATALRRFFDQVIERKD